MNHATDARWPLRLLWPAFLSAAVLEAVVFAVVDPASLHWNHHTLDRSRQAVYAIGFFVFWAISYAGQWAACLIVRPGQPSKATPMA